MRDEREATLAMIKPEAAVSHSGVIIARIEQEGFAIREMVKRRLSLADAEMFYAVHAQQPFYEETCHYMITAPVVIMVLEKVHAVADFRALIGATDPAKADLGTLRRQFGTSIGRNALHGSDSLPSAEREIAFFFGRRCRCKGGSSCRCCCG